MEASHDVHADARAVDFPDGSRLVRSWIPKHTASDFALGVVHGLGDHSGRYDAFGRWFARRGVPIFSFDQIGHGESPGERVVIPSYEYLLRDVDFFLSWVSVEVRIPVGLFGQSMGGNLVLNHQLGAYSDAAFVVAGSPMLRVPKPPAKWMQLLYRTVHAIRPNLILKTPVDPANLSRDPEVQQGYLDDPLVEQKLSLKLGIALIDSGEWALQHAAQMRVPALLTHGEADRITCPLASREFAERSEGRAECHVWPEGVHDLHTDIIKEQYLENILKWMSQHADAS
ncbi:MAG: alpha/beta fold hydrolase [Planctomycetota bacterium]